MSERASPIAADDFGVAEPDWGGDREASATADAIVAYLARLPHHEAWSGGRPLLAPAPCATALQLANLVSEIAARAAFADPSCRSRPARSAKVPGIVDPVLDHLAEALAASRSSHTVNRRLIHSIVLAVRAHLAAKYGTASPPAQRRKSGALQDSQLRIAKALLTGNLGGEVRLAEIARRCGLSRQYFAKAFKASTGMPPRRWLRHYRVESAKRMLREGSLPVADIAIACGFADQSHFTRVFAMAVGTSPAAWRRENR
ncbi:MAG: AraC family transcriptional regulator [Xanthobacteraceae bacterium]|nr:AraC family transcriptional regulator [Xanthobacteraceae bacterium]